VKLRAWIERGLSLRGLITLTAVALLLRIVACFATGAFETPSGRWEHGYEVGAVAVSLAEGRGFSSPFLSETGPTAAVGPALPFLWSLVLRTFGSYSAGAWAGFVLLNALFSALVVPAAHALGRRCGGPAIGLLAALAWTLHPVAVFGPTGYQSASGLFALFVTISLERFVALEQADGEGRSLRRLAVSAGLWFGAGLWVEPLSASSGRRHALVPAQPRRDGSAGLPAVLGGAGTLPRRGRRPGRADADPSPPDPQPG